MFRIRDRLSAVAEHLRATVASHLWGETPPAIYYWRPNDHRGRDNLGDYLTRVIVGSVLRARGVPPSAIRFTSERKGRRLLAIGSILHHAREGDVVWGSGVNGKALGRKPPFEDLDLRMVRGPLTRDYLRDHGIDCPARYGEPGLLVSEFYQPNDRSRTDPYLLVPNLNDTLFFDCDRERVLSPTSDWTEAVDRICRAELVISTSLHGLVIAESYGVPARALLSYAEPTFKYRDYYAGTGRTGVRFAHTISEARELAGVRPPDWDASDMIEAFPWNCFTQNRTNGTPE